MILARIILSWVVNSYTLEKHPLGYWLHALTEPFLRWFRRLPFAVIGGMIDISPIFALFSITLAQRFLNRLIATQSAPFSTVLLGMIFQLILGIVSIAKTIVIIAALILFFRMLHAIFSRKASYSMILNHIDFYVRKIFQNSLKFLNMGNGNLNTQITSLFIIACLISYLLSLSETLLGNFFTRVLSQL